MSKRYRYQQRPRPRHLPTRRSQQPRPGTVRRNAPAAFIAGVTFAGALQLQPVAQVDDDWSRAPTGEHHQAVAYVGGTAGSNTAFAFPGVASVTGDAFTKARHGRIPAAPGTLVARSQPQGPLQTSRTGRTVTAAGV